MVTMLLHHDDIDIEACSEVYDSKNICVDKCACVVHINYVWNVCLFIISVVCTFTSTVYTHAQENYSFIINSVAVPCILTVYYTI